MLFASKDGAKYFDHYVESNANRKCSDGLIKEYIISPEIFCYMAFHQMIEYSVDMAEYYGLEPECAYDKKYTGKPFKWASKKGKVLVKQKQGIFN